MRFYNTHINFTAGLTCMLGMTFVPATVFSERSIAVTTFSTSFHFGGVEVDMVRLQSLKTRAASGLLDSQLVMNCLLRLSA